LALFIVHSPKHRPTNHETPPADPRIRGYLLGCHLEMDFTPSPFRGASLLAKLTGSAVIQERCVIVDFFASKLALQGVCPCFVG
jgi:hypothetical protein